MLDSLKEEEEILKKQYSWSYQMLLDKNQLAKNTFEDCEKSRVICFSYNLL